jgi:Fe2+ or Zn2+ uptake regulation protein
LEGVELKKPSRHNVNMLNVVTSEVEGRYQELCTDALRQSGARITRARKTIIEALAEIDRPLSASALYDYIIDSPTLSTIKIDKVTVYRVLEALHGLGLVHQITRSGEYISCSHLECHAAYHVISHCTGCSAVDEIDIPASVIEPLLQHLRTVNEFSPDDHVLHIDGKCSECRQATSNF